MATKPIAGIEPFTGRAAKWLTQYLHRAKADPEKQREVNRRIRAGAARVAPGKLK
jgi:hypothetical protein